MPFFDKVGKRSSSGGIGGIALRILLRFLQFVLALTVAGLYGVDLNHARQAHQYMDSKWVYAEVTAGLSAATCIIYAVLICVPSEKFFAWDWVLFVLWTALFGIFGHIYIPADPTPRQDGQLRMKHAVWVDLVNMILWFISACYATYLFWRTRSLRGQEKMGA